MYADKQLYFFFRNSRYKNLLGEQAVLNKARNKQGITE